MPHLTLEVSRNLEPDGDLEGLCTKLARALVAQLIDGKPIYPIGGVRVRAYPCAHYCIADGTVTDAGFVHGVLKVGAGRGEATLKLTGDTLFEVMKQHFATQFERQGLALSLEIGEFSESGTWKHNNLHARFRKG